VSSDNMIVHLVVPSFDDIYGKRAWPHVTRPTLGLLYLATPLLEMGVNVKYFELDIEDLIENYIKELSTDQPAIVAFSLVTPLFGATAKIVELVRTYSPRSLVVVGGDHATALPHDTLKRLPADAVCIGAGQEIFPHMVRALIDGKPFEEAAQGFLTPQNPNAPFYNWPGWDKMPIPARQLLKLDKYLDYFDGKLVPHMTTFTAYGCVGKCKFCVAPWNHIFYRDMKDVVDEIEYCLREYGIDKFLFEDDTFGIPPKRMEQFAQLILERKIDIKYVCHIRLDCVTRESLSLMHQTGCVKVMPGIESGNNDILKAIGKQITVETIRKSMALIKEFPFDMRPTFLLGWVDETREQMEQTIALAKELNLPRASFNIATPLPGRWLWDEAMKRGKLKEPVDFSRLSFYNYPMANMSKVSDDELYDLCRNANREMRILG